jgi:hypothetical protein
MCNGASRTDIFTTYTHNYTCILVFYNRFLFLTFHFETKSLHVTEIYALSAPDTFFIIYFWATRYFTSRNALICFFRHKYCPFFIFIEGRDRDLNPGKRLHRPLGYQATSPRPHIHAFRCLRPLFAVSNLGFCRFIAYTLFSFTEDFPAIIVLPSDILKSHFNELAGLFSVVGYPCYELVAWQILEKILFQLNV